MKNKPDTVLVNMTVEDFVGDGYDTKVSEIAGDGTKRIRFGEHRLKVPITVVTLLADILVEGGVTGASKDRLECRSRNVLEKTFIYISPVYLGILGRWIGVGVGRGCRRYNV